MLVRYDPFREFDRKTSRRQWMPMDAFRHDQSVELRFDLPGIDPESIEVTVDKGVLTVGASRTEEYAEDERPYRRERVMGSFARRVYLSDAVDSEKIDAAYAGGVLTVRLPLLEKAQPRKVEIHTDGQKEIAA